MYARSREKRSSSGMRRRPPSSWQRTVTSRGMSGLNSMTCSGASSGGSASTRSSTQSHWSFKSLPLSVFQTSHEVIDATTLGG